MDFVNIAINKYEVVIILASSSFSFNFWLLFLSFPLSLLLIVSICTCLCTFVNKFHNNPNIIQSISNIIWVKIVFFFFCGRRSCWLFYENKDNLEIVLIYRFFFICLFALRLFIIRSHIMEKMDFLFTQSNCWKKKNRNHNNKSTTTINIKFCKAIELLKPRWGIIWIAYFAIK